MTAESTHVAVRPGSGLVAREGVGLLVVLDGGTDAVREQLLDTFTRACADQATPGRTMARRLVGLLSQADPDDVPAFGACAPSERGWAVILHQGVALHVQQGGETTSLSGFDASTWVDRIVDDAFDTLTLIADGVEMGAVNTRYRFDGGVIPGGGVTIIHDDANPSAMGQGTVPAPDAAPDEVPDVPAQAVVQAPPAMDVPAAPDAPEMQVRPVDAAPPTAEPDVVPAPKDPAASVQADLPAGSTEPAADAAPTPLFSSPTPTADPVQQPGSDATQASPAADEPEPPTLIQQPDRSAEPAAEPQAEPDAVPAEDVPFESVPLIDVGPEARREPLPVLSSDTPKEEVEDSEAPLVYGVLSPAGYFNHPDSLYCAVTGVSMLHRTHVLVQKPRPPLGVVVADDGSTYTLNKNYIVGREPERDPAVESDSARPLKLQDSERSLSRVHADIRLVDWDVYIVDRGSANGTYVLPRGAQQWKRLVADTQEKIVPGTRVAFGKRVITFESHHQINQAAS